MPPQETSLRLGTRGSLLAMTQADSVRKMLLNDFEEVEIVQIRTSGDQGNRDTLGAFVSEIEQALREDRIDVALHCLKDIPTRPLDGLTMAAYLQREDPRDAMLTRSGPFSDLPAGSIIGTGSIRRTSQLAAHVKEFSFKRLIGNVDTRLKKLHEGEYDAIILAAAGLNRLRDSGNWDVSRLGTVSAELLDPALMLPAAGQGILVLQMREGDPRASTVSRLDHLESRVAGQAERAFLGRFGGGCSVPVAALAEPDAAQFKLSGLVSTPDGLLSYRDSKPFNSTNSEAVGIALAEELGAQGGFEIIDQLVGSAAR